MRFASLVVGIFAALLFAPHVVLENDDVYRRGLIQASLLAPLPIPEPKLSENIAKGQGVLMSGAPDFPAFSYFETGTAALMFLAPFRLDTMPLLPDIPETIAQIDFETAPTSHAGPAQLERLTLKDVKPVTAKFSGAKGRITGNSLNMRAGPAKRFKPVAVLRSGDNVRLVGRRTGDWVQVQLPKTGLKGWVFHRYVVPL